MEDDIVDASFYLTDRTYGVSLMRKQSIVVLYTFVVSSYSEHLNMLEASIISVLRELKELAFIIIYTTTKPDLIFLKERYSGFNGGKLKIKTYHPIADPKYEFTGGLSVFNQIGHSRIYLINKLLQWYEKPVIYLDNDTLITPQRGDAVIKLCFGTVVYGYAKESWVTFDDLNEQFKYYCSFPIGSPYRNWLNLNPINNGVQIYPFNENSIAFAEDVISTYVILDQTCQSHFHDMLAFSVVWYKYLGSKCLDEGIPSLIYGKAKYGSGQITQTSVPDIIHYYMNKYDNLNYINQKCRLLIEKFLSCQATYLKPSEISGSFLINEGLVCQDCPFIIDCEPNDECDNFPCEIDCFGIPGGSGIVDCAGVCFSREDGPQHLVDCNGTCYSKNQPPPHLVDCAGVCFSREDGPQHYQDCAGVCFNKNTPPPHYQDCSGLCFPKDTRPTHYADCRGNCVSFRASVSSFNQFSSKSSRQFLPKNA